jgi:aspartyl aminopeptidase
VAGRERRPLERGGALVAWRSPADATATARFRIVGAHTDSPNLRIKPHPDTGNVGWRQLAVEVYGGALVNSWLYRDLGLSGRLVRRDGEVVLILLDEPLAAPYSSPSTSTGTSTSVGSSSTSRCT